MVRWKAHRPQTLVDPVPTPEARPTAIDERRALAFARALPLLATSIPTADIVASYLDDVLPDTAH